MMMRDYKVRVFIVFIGFAILFFIVLTRLFLIQIKQTFFFKKLAQFQYEQELTVYPSRAPIFDRSGEILAFNKSVYSAFLIPHQLKEATETKKFLRHEYPDVYKRLKKNNGKHFLWLDRKLTPEKYMYLKNCGLGDIHFIEEQERYYSLPSGSQIIGLVDIDSNGIAGLELQFTKDLAGLPSRVYLEKDARSKIFYFKRTIHEQGVMGKPLITTIDSGLQNLAHHELAESIKNFNAQSGSVLIMNPDTGEILSMVTYPSLDPNSKDIDSLDSLKNDIICECYELGSVIKPFSALAALEEGVVEFDEPIDCEAQITKIDGFKVENPTISLNRILREHDYVIPFYDVVRYSSNVGIAKVTKRLGTKLYDHLVRIGFGKKTSITFPGERDGFVNHPKNWSKPSPIVMSFGYEIMVSLLQLARAYCLIANGGYLVNPTLVMPTSICPEGQASKLIVSDNSSKPLYSKKSILQIKDILEKIVHRFAIPGFRTMGKTGTARCVKDGKYSDSKHHYTFAGILERGDYKRVIVTFVKEPIETKKLWASQVSGPLFKAVAEKMVIRDMMLKKLI